MTPRNLLAAAAVSAAGLAPAALTAVADQTGIPPRALQAYVAAAAQAPCPIPWSTLAAIGAVETGHGTFNGAHLDPDGRMTTMAVSSAAALGPMQFLRSTWEEYGQGGDVNDIDDAAPATARKLCADGYATDPTNAIGSYNGGPLWRNYAESQSYVVLVDEYVTVYAKAGPLEANELEVDTTDGIAGRLADRLVVRTLDGWERLGRWVTRTEPDTAPAVDRIDREIATLTGTSPAPASPVGRRPEPVVNGLVCPVAGAVITSDWGDARDGGARTHQGIDLAADEGTPVLSPFPARVTETIDVEADGGLGGISLWLEATSGPHKGAAVYIAHSRRNIVFVGQTVAQGQQVAELGNTGVGTGPHAHVSWAPNGGAFTNPIPIRDACQQKDPR